jgi:DNA repair protein RadC
MPAGDRPRERLEYAGPAALSSAELVAILLRTGCRGENALQMATRLLAEFKGLSGLASASFAELAVKRGVGKVKAAQIKAGLEVGRRWRATAPEDDRPQINSPLDAANLLMLEMCQLEQEQLRLVLLDTKNRVLSMPTLYQGNVNTTVVRVAELFREAIRCNATALIVVHNHPSGDPTPSQEDVRITRQIVEAGEDWGSSNVWSGICTSWQSARASRAGISIPWRAADH